MRNNRANSCVTNKNEQNEQVGIYTTRCGLKMNF